MSESLTCEQMFSIKKFFKFEAAHRLLCMPEGHHCKNFHGHSYVVTVEIFTSSLNEQYMVLDFGKLKIFQKYLDTHFDHSLVLSDQEEDEQLADEWNNQRITVMNGYPTAENMAKLFCEQIEMICEQYRIRPKMIRIEVAETVGNIATYQRKYDEK